MAQNIQDSIKSAVRGVAELPTKHPLIGPMMKVGRAGQALSKKMEPAPRGKMGVHASQMKKRSMSATEARQQRMMRKRAGR